MSGNPRRRGAKESLKGAAGRQTVRLERAGPDGLVVRVTIARPEVRNAFDAEVVEQLRTAFEGFAGERSDRLRAVVLAGDGPAFCAGGHRDWMQAAGGWPPEANLADALGLARMYAAIDGCPVPVIARVQGAALGGGAGLCAVADVVIAEAGTVFGFPEVRIGILPSTIAPYVVARLGEGPARALFLTGRRVDAAEAHRIGLVHEVVDGLEALEATVEAAVADVLAGAPEGVRAAKQLIRDLRARAPGESAQLTARLLADRRASAEATEGLQAAVERRPPAWTKRSAG